jgi:hypothetical protein
MDAETVNAVVDGIIRIGREYDVTAGVMVGAALLYFVFPKVAGGLAAIRRAGRGE